MTNERIKMDRVVAANTVYDYCLVRITVRSSPPAVLFRLDALVLSVIATATWLAGWLGGCLSQPVLYQND